MIYFAIILGYLLTLAWVVPTFLYREGDTIKDVIIYYCFIHGIVSFIITFGYLFYVIFSYFNIPI